MNSFQPFLRFWFVVIDEYHRVAAKVEFQPFFRFWPQLRFAGNHACVFAVVSTLLEILAGERIALPIFADLGFNPS